ncbi:MAG: fumarylacetoacetate hydrolase family protein [Candidatus Bathyarchaeia archaeon]|nr:fumarylacetoacetate hydrolase family protein [Candidatus Bathyarchaeota archaeon]
MRIIRFSSPYGNRIGVWVNDEVIDVTEICGSPIQSFLDLASKASEAGKSIDGFLKDLIERRGKELPTYSYGKIERCEDNLRLLIPIVPPEVWGCGVTYRRSREARERETGVKGLYDLVYDAIRPEIFFKATAHRCVGPGEEIGIRGDSKRSIPEAELAFILGFNQEILGFTAGNDVSSSDIEGENPLYLPQAKIFDRCCALGPSILTVDEAGKEPKLRIECRVFRSGNTVFEGSTSTSEMRRSIEELRSYLCRYNPVPPGSVCLTGTGIIPPEDFSLRDGDIVEITIEKIGTLRNPVRRL